ncbi:hypothetical protein GQ44DRAFT_76759 [Phaeosphaeriaceae sp. PMI808]|nr:hypothetical protein GQ44DRAFT_76759 [Phaeosphaeriaceae sp. PMI808]
MQSYSNAPAHFAQQQHQHQQQHQQQQQQQQHQQHQQHQQQQHHQQHHQQHQQQQQQQHHQHPNHPHHTASPSTNSVQSYVGPQMQQSPGPVALASNGHQHPMSHVQAEQPQVHTPVKPVPLSPVSPVAHARTQDRIATLLEINSILIKEVCDLQAQGKAGQVGQSADGKPEGDKPPPAKEYVDYMRRLQANLAYLAQNAEKNPKPGQQIQPGPAIMSIPTAHLELGRLYQKLIELYPGWKGQTAQMKQSPGPHRMNSTASTTSQPPNSAGLQQNWSQNAMANMQQAQAQAKIEP